MSKHDVANEQVILNEKSGKVNTVVKVFASTVIHDQGKMVQ